MNKPYRLQHTMEGFEPHNVQADVQSPALKTCKKLIAGCFDYSVLSITVIVLLLITLCIIAFSRPRGSPVSFTIKKAKFNINSVDQDEDVEKQNQTTVNRSDTTQTVVTLPPLPDLADGSGDFD